MGIIYLAINSTNGKKYVGQTTLPLVTRWRLHVSAARNGSKLYFHSAIRKYGAQHFSLQELAQADSQQQLDTLEKFYIEQHGTRTVGYNIAVGGQHHSNHEKMSASARLRENSTKGRKWVHKKDGSKARVHQHEVGDYLKQGWQLGNGPHRPWTVEERQRIGDKQRGRKLPIAHRQKISESNMGKKRSLTTKEKISQKWTLERRLELRNRTIDMNRSRAGKPRKSPSADTRRKIALAQQGQNSLKYGARWMNKDGMTKLVLINHIAVHSTNGWGFGRRGFNRYAVR